jgi:ATP-dependent RNA helicase DHR2
VCREQEAAAAQKEFRSPLGDHITLLHVMRAFEALPQKKRGAWCHRHFVSFKALRHAEKVQAQLQARSSAALCTRGCVFTH